VVSLGQLSQRVGRESNLALEAVLIASRNDDLKDDFTTYVYLHSII